MKIALVGLSHNTAPVALRERLAFAESQLPAMLAALTALPAVAEGVVLSTCNRVEVYLAGRDPEQAAAQCIHWLGESRGIPRRELEPHLYAKLEGEAMAHGFRVAASLDSLVVGEPQILGQMKSAFQEAVAARACGPILTKYFHRAFQVAKRVRSETSIAENAVSVSYAAVELAKKIFGDLTGRSCLLIGAGEMCELAARHLVSNGVGRVLVTNRTLARAESLAGMFDGHAFPLEALAGNLDQADIVISSTGSTRYLVEPAMVRAALKRRRQRPMFFIDIAVPRDLDPRIGELDSAFLYDMDDLQQIVARNREDRQRAASQAEGIIAEELPAFQQWLEGLAVVPTIVALRQRLEAIQEREVEKMLHGCPRCTPEEQQRLRQLARGLVKKILHDPLTQLRALGGQEDGELYVDAARKLFRLDRQ